MPDWLVIPEHRVKRLVHEQARVFAGERRLHWIRVWLTDVDNLAGESPMAQFLDLSLPLLAAASGAWKVPNDPRWIAARFGVRTRDVGPALRRLIELDRLELVTDPASQPLADPAQPRLFGSGPAEPPRDHRATTARPPRDPGTTPTVTPPGAEAPTTSQDAAETASHSRALCSPRAEQSRAEGLVRAERTPDTPDEPAATVPPPCPQNDSTNTPESLRRLAALAARGKPEDQAQILRAGNGLPEAAIGRAFEAYLERRPRPRNPAGYVVATLKAIRAERSAVDPEPRL